MKVDIKDEINVLIKNAQTVYVSSIDGNGYPNTKAMYALYHEGLKLHYFSTCLSSRRTEQFRVNPKACIYFCNEEKSIGLMLVGNMEICTDDYHKELLWREGFEIYYPNGVNDENYCVYKFTALNGRFYYGLDDQTFIEEDINNVEF